jgi:hypothetical protein
MSRLDKRGALSITAARQSRTEAADSQDLEGLVMLGARSVGFGDEVLAVLRVIQGRARPACRDLAGMTDRAMANCAAGQRALLFLPLSGVPFASAAGT